MATRQALVILSLSLAAAMAVAACSETTKYRVLSFFLDGVPKPGEVAEREPGDSDQAPAVADTSQRPPAPLLQYAHPPFRENKCGSCHSMRTGQLYRTPQEGLCRTCHRDFPGDAAYLHGPVAVRACLFCHHHHASHLPKMLLTEQPDLCFRCHVAEDLTEGPHHEIIDGRACVQCHDPHGGNNPYFLKPREDWGQYLHGPAAVGDCGFCHGYLVSRAREPRLSKIAGLCFTCHRSGDLTEGPHHALIGEQACTECHNPHGGADRFFLMRGGQ